MIALEEFIEVLQGNIENAKEEWEVDTIVNAARPSLMGGSGLCVDAAIHKKIDSIHDSKGFLKKEILRELGEPINSNENKIRCRRGSIVKTAGYKLCESIIHTVGPRNDEDGKWPNTCSSSTVNTLKSCYREIINEALEDSKIKRIAIPVISAGNYGIKFNLAFRIGLSEVYNTLLERKRKDPEMLEYTTLEKIYFVIPDATNYEQARKVLRKYKRTFKKEKRVVSHNSFVSQLQILKQIQLYDVQNGYFTISRALRYILVLVRLFVFPFNYLKDVFGRENWETRRRFVERFAILKVLLSAFLLWMVCNHHWTLSQDMFGGIMMYNLVDTMTYLLALIVLADIQNPSANVIRSLLMLLVNYIETGIELAGIGLVWLDKSVPIQKLLLYGLANVDLTSGEQAIETLDNAWYLCMNGGIKFFFITLVFGYFANSLRERRFRDC